jgi:hypothetical protein
MGKLPGVNGFSSMVEAIQVVSLMANPLEKELSCFQMGKRSPIPKKVLSSLCLQVTAKMNQLRNSFGREASFAIKAHAR